MEVFAYRGDELYCEATALAQIAAAVGTPTYVYSRQAILDRFSAYDHAFADVPHLVCYAVKANGNLGLLHCLAQAGAGADVVSGGELFRALRAGIDPKKIVFAGVGKTREELREALKADILLFNVESPAECALLSDVARAEGVRARVALRINPDIDPQTHPYISTGLKYSKFGIPIARAEAEYAAAARLPGLEITGLHMHIGSQITNLQPYADSLDRIVTLVERLRKSGIPIQCLDLGGGLGIRYRDETPPAPEEYTRLLIRAVRALGVTVIIEPGRSIVGNAGALLTRILYWKTGEAKEFVIVDAAMNDLIRPSLYNAYHEILPVRRVGGQPRAVVDVVGPICESGDFLAKGRELPRVEAGELLAVLSAGAYGFAMASNYNARPRAAEVLVTGARFSIVRRRESYEELIAGEQFPEG